MISICIPIFNYDVRDLVHSLYRQAESRVEAFEILLTDDGSSDNYKKLNRQLLDLNKVVYKELNKNVGRSMIRNMLAADARYSRLIFMDCDSGCPDEKYIDRYMDAIHAEGVVCGGRIYDPLPPTDETYLHWLFGTKREVKSAETRKKRPYHSFMTNNFMIGASVMQKIRFNESLKGYGHEDTLFGLELKKSNINITHIDNPLIHIGLQGTEEFLDKTKEGIINLLRIYEITGKDQTLRNMVKLLKTLETLQKTGSCRVIGKTLELKNPLLLLNLRSKNPKLFFLDLFKLKEICLQGRHKRLNNTSR